MVKSEAIKDCDIVIFYTNGIKSENFKSSQYSDEKDLKIIL